MVQKKDEEKLLKRKRDSTSSNGAGKKKTKEEQFSCDDCIFKTNTIGSLKEHKENSCQEFLD